MEISKLLNIINSKNGVLLTVLYGDAVPGHSKVLIQCQLGHEFFKNYAKLQAGEWCPRCSKKGKIPLEEIKKFAILKGGKCLSEIMINCKDKLLWECQFGHRWKTTYGSILYMGTWCPTCAGRNTISIDNFHDLAASKNGKCLSKEYIGYHEKHLWECQLGHRWEANLSNVKKGKWCPTCSNNKKLTIDDLNIIASRHGGYLLSSEYVNSGSKIQWQCKFGHVFELSCNFITSKNMWCPKCFNTKSFSEELCRAVFEFIFGEKFLSCFPKWLVGNKNRSLQLDGFCENLKIAFEHQGEQHYSQKNSFFKTEQQFLDLLERDKIKIRVCTDNGVKLFIIPALFTLTPLDELIEVIKFQSTDLNIKPNFNIDINKIYYDMWKLADRFEK